MIQVKTGPAFLQLWCLRMHRTLGGAHTTHTGCCFEHLGAGKHVQKMEAEFCKKATKLTVFVTHSRQPFSHIRLLTEEIRLEQKMLYKLPMAQTELTSSRPVILYETEAHHIYGVKNNAELSLVLCPHSV